MFNHAVLTMYKHSHTRTTFKIIYSLKSKSYEGTSDDYGVKDIPNVSTVGAGVQNKA